MKPLTVLLTPPIISPTGRAGKEKVAGAAALVGKTAESRLLTGETADVAALPCKIVESRLLAGGTAGAGAGGHVAGGSVLLLAYECLRAILKPPFINEGYIQTLNSII